MIACLSVVADMDIHLDLPIPDISAKNLLALEISSHAKSDWFSHNDPSPVGYFNQSPATLTPAEIVAQSSLLSVPRKGKQRRPALSLLRRGGQGSFRATPTLDCGAHEKGIFWGTPRAVGASLTRAQRHGWNGRMVRSPHWPIWRPLRADTPFKAGSREVCPP